MMSVVPQRLLLLLFWTMCTMMFEFGIEALTTIPILQRQQQQRKRQPIKQPQQRRHDRFDILHQQPYQKGRLQERFMMSKNEKDDDRKGLAMDISNEPSTTTTTTTNTNTNTETPTTTRIQQQIQYIGTMDDRIQQITFITAFVLLGFGTQFFIHVWYTIGIDVLGHDYFYYIQTQLFPIVFGTIFTLVGISHFVFVENFARIVPPYNGWGQLWKLPAPFHTQMNISYEEYHSYSSGIVELIGGIWLLYTGIMSSMSVSVSTISLPATLLFALTIGVTPANLYMFTHNASPGGIVPPLQYPYGHIARFIIQCGLLSNFYIMMYPIHS